MISGIEGYISEAVAGGALLCLWLGIRTHRGELDKEYLNHQEKINAVIAGFHGDLKELQNKGLTNKEHSQLCYIQTLELKTHVSAEIKNMLDLIFQKMDKDLASHKDLFKDLGEKVLKNSNSINTLNIRTRHLKDVDID